MSTLTEWIKPSGAKVMLNDAEATVEYAKENGYKPFDETPDGLAMANDLLAAREARAEETVAAHKAQDPVKSKKAN